jgi:hypothetical protein
MYATGPTPPPQLGGGRCNIQPTDQRSFAQWGARDPEGKVDSVHRDGEPFAAMLALRKVSTLVFAAAALVAALYPALSHLAAEHTAARRVDALSAALGGPTSETSSGLAWVSLDSPLQARLDHLGPLLASWETVGGCGAGASTGAGGGIKWIGRNVTGGLFHVELQNAYIHTDYGYNYVATALISRDLTPDWSLSLSVPYLYKYIHDPYGLGVDVVNQGPGDIGALLTRRLGVIRDWSTTLLVGAPTGAHDAYFRSPMNILPQDRQLGLGPHSTTVVTASLIVDHTIDQGWGPAVVGGTMNWRGGTNELRSYRAPSASLYSYAGYLLGPLVPALGVSVTGAAGHDRDQGGVQPTPLFTVAASASIEWSTDWLAVIVGGSLPYGYTNSVLGSPAAWGMAPWVVALGVAFAPF